MVYHESETESESDRTSILIADEVILKEIAMEAKYFLDAPDATADNIAPSIISLRKCRVVHIRIALETIQLILDNDVCVQSNKMNAGGPQCHVSLLDDTTSIVLTLLHDPQYKSSSNYEYSAIEPVLVEDDLNIVHSHRKGYSYRSVGITQAVLQSYKLQQELRFAGVERISS